MKVFVTGNAGSGKTTLAHSIGAELSLPVYGLDSIVWSAGWKKTSPRARAEGEHHLISQSSWVIDGVSPQVQNASDVTILLDVPRRTSFRRCAFRNWRYLFRSRPGLPDNCPEILIIPQLCRIIWRFPSAVLPKIIENANSNGKIFFRVRDRAELRIALASLGMTGDALR